MPYQQLAKKDVIALNAGFLNLIRRYSPSQSDAVSCLMGTAVDFQHRLCSAPISTLNDYCTESRFVFFRPRQIASCDTGNNVSSGRVISGVGDACCEHSPMSQLAIQAFNLCVAYHTSASVIAKIMPQVCVDIYGVSWACIPLIQNLSHYQIADLCHSGDVRFEPRVPMDFLLDENVEHGLNDFVAKMTAGFTRASQPGVI